jgi:hypothetical protein
VHLGKKVIDIFSFLKAFDSFEFPKLQHSIAEWRKNRKTGEKKESILDYAEPRYGKSFVDDVKALKSVTYMFLPFPVFWALFDQQVSLEKVCTQLTHDLGSWYILFIVIDL